MPFMLGDEVDDNCETEEMLAWRIRGGLGFARAESEVAVDPVWEVDFGGWEELGGGGVDLGDETEVTGFPSFPTIEIGNGRAR